MTRSPAPRQLPPLPRAPRSPPLPPLSPQQKPTARVLMQPPQAQPQQQAQAQARIPQTDVVLLGPSTKKKRCTSSGTIGSTWVWSGKRCARASTVSSLVGHAVASRASSANSTGLFGTRSVLPCGSNGACEMESFCMKVLGLLVGSLGIVLRRRLAQRMQLVPSMVSSSGWVFGTRGCERIASRLPEDGYRPNVFSFFPLLLLLLLSCLSALEVKFFFIKNWHTGLEDTIPYILLDMDTALLILFSFYYNGSHVGRLFFFFIQLALERLGKISH